MSDISEYIRITELIGEMAWGIELPSPMTVYVQELGGKPEKCLAIDPKNYEVVFEAIYQKLKTNTDYNPFIKQKDEIIRLKQQLDQAIELLKIFVGDESMNPDLIKWHVEKAKELING